MDHQQIAKVLFTLGGLLLVVGALFWFSDQLPFLKKIGRLPGDIHIKNKNSEFYFPIVTCILVSLILSALSWFFRK